MESLDVTRRYLEVTNMQLENTVKRQDQMIENYREDIMNLLNVIQMNIREISTLKSELERLKGVAPHSNSVEKIEASS